MNTLMSIDPGKTTGVAILHGQGEVSVYNTTTREGLKDLFTFYKPKTVLIERVFIGSMATRTEGFVSTGHAEAFADLVDAEIVFREPNQPSIIQRRFNCTKKRNWTQHTWDALSHVASYVYYLSVEEYLPYLRRVLTDLGATDFLGVPE